jgi:hypothetical protein
LLSPATFEIAASSISWMNAAVLVANSGKSGNLLPTHDCRCELLGKRVRIGKGSGGGVDVDHRH